MPMTIITLEIAENEPREVGSWSEESWDRDPGFLVGARSDQAAWPEGAETQRILISWAQPVRFEVAVFAGGPNT